MKKLQCVLLILMGHLSSGCLLNPDPELPAINLVPTPSLTLQTPSPSYNDSPSFKVSNIDPMEPGTLTAYGDGSCSTPIGGLSYPSWVSYITFSLTTSGAGTGIVSVRISNNKGASQCSNSVSYTRLAPPVPTAISLTSPSSSPGYDPTPTLLVSGVASGLTVEIHKNATCTSFVNNQTATGSGVSIDLPSLAVGTHTLYARTKSGTLSSACSSAYVSYQLQNSTINSFQLSQPGSATHHSPRIGLGLSVTPNTANVGIYSDATCATLVASGTLYGGTGSIFVQGITPGLHTYYAKIIGSSELTPSSCSSGINYTVVPRLAMAGAVFHSTPYSVSRTSNGDFNEDGKIDLIAPMSAGTTTVPLYLYLGNGDSSFQTPVSLGNFQSIEEAESADLNGDAHLDITLISSGNKMIYVLLGNGDGTFASPVQYSVASAQSQPRQLEIIDFNNDSIHDIVSMNYASASYTGTLSLLIGNGDGSFQSAVNTNTPAEQKSLVAADLNGDGKIDLTTGGGFLSTSLNVFLGNGDGTLQAYSSYPIDHYVSSVSLADLNGDGRLDAVSCVETTGPNAAIMINNGNGTFAAATHYNHYGNYDMMAGNAVADMDGDGKLDILTTHSGSTKMVSVAYGDGAGGLELPEYLTVSNSIRTIQTLDPDADSDTDVLVTTTGTPGFYFFKNLKVP